MAVDVLAPKGYRKAPPQVKYDQATFDFVKQHSAEMLAHCVAHQRPQDWDLLAVIIEDAQADHWKSLRAVSCEYCAKNDVPMILDKDGVSVFVSKETGNWSHAYDCMWWTCTSLSHEQSVATV
ncbi:MAG: hypothetical protein HOP19_16365 [Acidobacteria bacterium]|nr:hypothetical protein [Acidobacteriota bacterium]